LGLRNWEKLKNSVKEFLFFSKFAIN